MAKLRDVVARWLRLPNLVEMADDISKIKTMIGSDSSAGILRKYSGDTTVVIVSRVDGGRVHIIDNIVIESEPELGRLIDYISKSHVVEVDNIIVDDPQSFRRSFVPRNKT